MRTVGISYLFLSRQLGVAAVPSLVKDQIIFVNAL
jgi:hypothetical protein